MFKETIKLASKNDLVDLNLICTDGSKIKANASKKKFLKEDQVNKLDSIIDQMIEEDIKRDEQEEETYGKSEINKTSLETKNLKEIVKTYRKNKDKQIVKEICKAAKDEFKKDEKIKRVSMTDPDCRMIKGKKGNYELAYNTQFTADSKNQIILANDVCQDNVDTHQLQPQIKKVKENIGLKEDTKIAADSNYNNSENLKFLEKENLIGYIPNQAQAQVMNCREQTIHQDNYEYDWKNDEIIIGGNRLKYHATWIHKKGSKQKVYKSEDRKLMKRVPEFFRERLRMKEKMETEEGREIYNKRKFVIEPVIGNIKYNYKFNEFSLRGLEGGEIRAQFGKYCT